MNRIPLLAGLTLATLLIAPDVAAQACIGFPSGSRGALGGTTSFHDDARSYGVSGLTTSGANLYLAGEAGITSYEFDIENETMVAATVAQEIEPLQATASVCPFTGLGYSFGGGYSLIGVPVGIGIGKTLPLGEGGSATLTPHIAPQFLWARTRVDGIDEADSESYFGVVAGGTVGVGQVVAGFTVSKIFEDDTDATLGLSAGFAF